MRFLHAQLRGRPVVGIVALSILGLLALLLSVSGCESQNTLVDFVQVGNIQYRSETAGGRQLKEADLGPEHAKVRFKVSGSTLAPGYRPGDGDAAILDPGTPLYEVKHYAASFRLAASANGAYRIYEVDTNPAAKVGSDLLDIAGKVTAIKAQSDEGAVSGASTPTPTTITDPQRITRLVDLIMRAPVESHPQGLSGPRIFLVFELADGTTTQAGYFPDTGLLKSYIKVPPEFRTALESALK